MPGEVPWSSVVDGMDQVVLLLDADHVITHASRGVVEHLGFAPESLVGLPLNQLLHADDLAAAWWHVGQGTLGSSRSSFLARLCTLEGGYQWSQCSLSSARGLLPGGGELVVLCARDATAHVDLQERLTAIDLRYRTLLDTLTEAVMFLDRDLTVETVNPGVAALLGWSAGDLLGRPYYEALNVWDEDGRRLGMRSPFAVRLVESPGPVVAWRSILRADGTRVLVRNRWSPLDRGAAGFRGYVLTMLDATGPRVEGARQPPNPRQVQAAAGLTARESDVLEGLAAGRDATEIAAHLRLSLHSVRGHIKGLMRKLGVHSQLQAVVAAARNGMVDVGGNRP